MKLNSKLSKIAAVFIAIALLSITALAVVSYAEWQDGTATKTIHKHESALFDVSIGTRNPPVTYNIKMYNPSGALVKTWYDTINTEGVVEDLGLAINPADTTVGGDYSIIISSTDSRGDSAYSTLTLRVLNTAPEIDWIFAPASVNEGDELNVAFGAHDDDGDLLSYKIYRNNAIVALTDHYTWDKAVAGNYNFTFEATDGEDSTNSTATVIVGNGNANNQTRNNQIEAKQTLVFSRDIEVSQDYGNFIKIRNTKGEKIDNFEIIITYLGTNGYEKYSFDLGKNDVVLKQMSTKLPENKTYAAKVEIKADGLEDSGYLLINA
jgi:hypothetical protein